VDNLPVYVRITTLAPTNEDVDSRRAAIATLSAAWGKISSTDSIMAKAGMIADSLSGDGIPYDDLGLEVQEALQEHASAFLYRESPLDVGLCAGMASLTMMVSEPSGSGWTILDVYSNALWSALSFQPMLTEEKREKLRREVLDRVQQRSRRSADLARTRSAVCDFSDLTVTIGDAPAKPSTNFKKATAATIEALRSNAALDREELDFLWWVQLNRSRLLHKPLARLDEPVRLVALGIEAAGHLRRLPADLHYDLVLRTVDADPELSLKELVDTIGDDAARLSESFDTARAKKYASVLPLLNALATGETNVAGAEVKRRASVWAGRALLEAGLSGMCDHGLSKQ
jgi:hypothetical protein